MVEKSLQKETEELLRSRLDRGIRVSAIVALSGHRLAYEWVRKFSRGEIDDPSVNRVEFLNRLLKHLEAMPTDLSK